MATAAAISAAELRDLADRTELQLRHGAADPIAARESVAETSDIFREYNLAEPEVRADFSPVDAEIRVLRRLHQQNPTREWIGAAAYVGMPPAAQRRYWDDEIKAQREYAQQWAPEGTLRARHVDRVGRLVPDGTPITEVAEVKFVGDALATWSPLMAPARAAPRIRAPGRASNGTNRGWVGPWPP